MMSRPVSFLAYAEAPDLENAAPPSGVRARAASDEAPVHRSQLAQEIRPMVAKRREFASTKWSLVLRAGAASPEALRELCEDYRGPLEAFARRIEADPERASDLVAGFLTRILELKVLGKADPTRGRFRAFLRKSLRNYAINMYHADHAKKRGGEAHFDEPDFDGIAAEGLTADQIYDRAWAWALINRALARLSEEQRTTADRWAVFEALRERLQGDDDGATLREAAMTLGKSEVALRVALFRLRQRFFDLIRAEVAATVERPEDVDAELCTLRAALRGER